MFGLFVGAISSGQADREKLECNLAKAATEANSGSNPSSRVKAVVVRKTFGCPVVGKASELLVPTNRFATGVEPPDN
jgi:hypothetical protein